MKKPKVIYQNNKSNYNLVLHRLFFKKKDILGLYSYKLRVFLKALLSGRCSNNGNNYIKNARNIRVAGITSSFLLVLLSAAIVVPIYNKTNSVEATTGTSKQSDTELSITTSSNIAGVDLLVKDNNGTFASSDDSGNTLGFNVTTNNYTGYTLTIASPDTTTYNNGKLTNTDTTNCADTTKCVLNTISSASNTISTNGTWGYKPSKLNSVTNSNYLPSPTTTATTLNTTSCANGTSPCTNANDAYTIAIAARADYTQPAGVYSNTYVLQATGNPVNYAITYNKNTTDTVTNMPTYSGSNTQSGSTSETEIEVSTTVPVRANYTFLGWCDTATTTTNNTDSCSGTIYNVNGAGTSASNIVYGIDQTTTNITTFYAMWKPNNYTITYNANGGTGSIASQSVTPGNSVTLEDNAYIRSNYYFRGWSTSAGGNVVAYRTNQSITPTSSMTLYAVWGNSTTTTLYNAVASLTRGIQTNDADASTGIQAAITKANSGVYTYNANVFGAASDAGSGNHIYYYRGILDKTTGTYGSDGDSMDYPNYVKLASDDGTTYTCWRIVRTTGSGGVKMVYNGKWTGSTCANSQSNAQLTTSAFNATSNVGDKSIIAVGYTFNSSYKTTTASTAAGTLFGTDSNYTGNNTRSTIKTYIEDTWYASGMTSWTSKLEANAGYCNDRSIYDTSNNKLSDTTSISTPYTTATSGITQYNFGARQRNFTTTQAPSLTCPYATRDLYRYVVSSTGTSNQLKYPAALLTADEMSFAGSGSSTATNGSGYHANSYLRSGFNFWLLPPGARRPDGYAYGFILSSGGDLGYYTVVSTNGVRPAISLKSGTTIASGSGTATDPWVITKPELYTITAQAGSNISGVSINGGAASTSVSGQFGKGEEITITATTSNYLSTWTNSSSNGIMTKTGTKTIKYTVGTGATIITAAATTSPTYIHNLTAANCKTNASNTNTIYNVYDYRDSKDYSVRYINGACWMTQNLRFTGTSANRNYTNVSSNRTLTWYDIKNDWGNYCNGYSSASYPYGYTYLCKHEPDSTNDSAILALYTTDQIGVWYNYAGATAGTIIGYENDTTDTYNLCPKNWSLPVYDINSPANSINNITSYADAFSPVFSGGMYSIYNTIRGDDAYWWTATASGGGQYRYFMGYYGDDLSDGAYANRHLGLSIRCVRTS